MNKPGNPNIREVSKATQFKPGQSGNPSGPKPGYKQISTWINELLNDEEFTATIQQGLKVVEYKGAPIKAIVQAQTRLAINGDTKAADLLMKHGQAQKIQLGNDPDNPLTNVADPAKMAAFESWLEKQNADT